MTPRKVRIRPTPTERKVEWVSTNGYDITAVYRGREFHVLISHDTGDRWCTAPRIATVVIGAQPLEADIVRVITELAELRESV